MQKTTKNVVRILTIAMVVVLALALVLVGCDKLKDAGKPEAEIGAKAITILVGTEEEQTTLNVRTDEEYMAQLLLKLAEENKITNYHSTTSTYGTYVDSINNIPGDVQGGYVSVYMSINDVELVDQSGFMPPVVIGGKTYYASNVGVDLIPIRDGESYLFLLGVWNG